MPARASDRFGHQDGGASVQNFIVDGNLLCSWYAHHEPDHGTYRIMGSVRGARRYKRERMVVLLTMIKETSEKPGAGHPR